MITDSDKTNMQSSLTNLIAGSMVSTIEDKDLGRVMDVIFTKDRQNRELNKRPLPVYLQIYCRRCGTYQDVIPLENFGYLCTTCSSKADEKKLPKRIKAWAVVFDKDKKPVRVISVIHLYDRTLIAAAWYTISKKAGFTEWFTDVTQESGGFFQNQRGEQCMLSYKEITIGKLQPNKSNPAVRPVQTGPS